MSGISLTSSMRSNLLSLKNTSSLIDMTQNRLSTGNKVNSAIDNPSSYYTARSLNNRANDLTSLLDSMGQAVSTIKAASETLESGLAFLEQATAIAEQARTETVSGKTLTKSAEDLKAEGYELITSDMDADEIEAKLTAGAKVALMGDVTLDRGLVVSATGVEINGNGYTINYRATTAGESVIKVNGAGATANIKNIAINASGEQLYGIAATNGGKITLDNANNIKVSGENSQKIWFRDENLYNGKANTEALIKEVGADALAATACSQFYVGDKNGEFGQGTWYLPAIGELMNAYGCDTTQITRGASTTGADPEYKNKTAINNALSTLASKGVETAILTESWYWSSSEDDNDDSWALGMSDSDRGDGNEDYNYYVRSFQLVENCFNPLPLSADAPGGSGSIAAPKVGQVMYADKTWGDAADYKNDGSMTAVGVITEVLDDGSVKIMSLKDLTFSSADTVGNFDPENPYGGAVGYSQHTTDAKYTQDVAGIENYDGDTILASFQSSGDVKISFTAETMDIDNSFTEQYNAVVAQYDALINDGSYKGVNLLKNESLSVRFNEDGQSNLNITGKDMKSGILGLTTAKWTSVSDIENSITQLKNAINSVRTFSTELGNNYSIVQTRENFTENLINVLTEGADKLTLADMNEESANILALQTRQQLAINSLSLAAQSAQAVLKLF